MIDFWQEFGKLKRSGWLLRVGENGQILLSPCNGGANLEPIEAVYLAVTQKNSPPSAVRFLGEELGMRPAFVREIEDAAASPYTMYPALREEMSNLRWWPRSRRRTKQGLDRARERALDGGRGKQALGGRWLHLEEVER
ncbi:MAG: hypothetical protein HY460_02505 [Parcubacteria group bacterium]|nr:hypothetical protein [Parcubacteria group bacterium]